MMQLLLWFFIPLYALSCVAFIHGLDKVKDWIVLTEFLAAVAVFCLLLFWFFFHRAYLKMKGFGLLSEAIFLCYGWPDVRTIDLSLTSKGLRPEPVESDPKGLQYRSQYFCYRPLGNQNDQSDPRG